MGEIEVRRSSRRKKTAQGYREAGKTIIIIPAHYTQRQERECVLELTAKLDRSEKLRSLKSDLNKRSHELNQLYFGGLATPKEVTWVSNQNTRWGSCTHEDRTIRISDRLIPMPSWVIDYVLVHELAHLIEPNHSKRFHELVAQYPHVAKAQGFLEGYSFGR